jgi:hypothetical protein
VIVTGVYQLGTAVTVTETFSVLGVPTNPTLVTYTVVDPNGLTTAYVFGVDAEVTNPGVGIFVLDLPPTTEPGQWLYSITGTGAVEAVGQGEFTVLQSSTAPQDVVFQQFGPCQPWIDCGDIRASCETTGDDALLDGIAAMASQIMFEVSGRQYGGVCEKTVRPCETLGNTCWGLNPWFGWTGWPWAWTWDGVTWGWYDSVGCHCTCQALSRVMLSGYPVNKILEVKIDGVVQAPTTYRLDESTFLTRMRDPLDPTVPLFWPACQILDLDDTEAGTWSVTYEYGQVVPLAGKAAATALACELLPGADCKLPSGAVRIVRQGITVDRLTPLAEMLRKGATGIVAIDTFIAAYNPAGNRRRPAVWSPDGPRYARPVGS